MIPWRRFHRTVLVAKGRWPLSTFVLVLPNDFLWWIPFAIYLTHAWPYDRRQEKELP